MAKINWTFQSLEDLDSIAEYHVSHSEKYASYLVQLIFDRTELIGQFPDMGRIVPEINISFIRELIVKNYRIIYSIANKAQIDILAIRSSSRPLDEIPLL